MLMYLQNYSRKAPCTTEQNSPARVRKTDSLDLSDSDEEIKGSKVDHKQISSISIIYSVTCIRILLERTLEQIIYGTCRFK